MSSASVVLDDCASYGVDLSNRSGAGNNTQLLHMLNTSSSSVISAHVDFSDYQRPLSAFVALPAPTRAAVPSTARSTADISAIDHAPIQTSGKDLAIRYLSYTLPMTRIVADDSATSPRQLQTEDMHITGTTSSTVVQMSEVYCRRATPNCHTFEYGVSGPVDELEMSQHTQSPRKVQDDAVLQVAGRGLGGSSPAPRAYGAPRSSTGSTQHPHVSLQHAQQEDEDGSSIATGSTRTLPAPDYPTALPLFAARRHPRAEDGMDQAQGAGRPMAAAAPFVPAGRASPRRFVASHTVDVRPVAWQMAARQSSPARQRTPSSAGARSEVHTQPRSGTQHSTDNNASQHEQSHRTDTSTLPSPKKALNFSSAANSPTAAPRPAVVGCAPASPASPSKSHRQVQGGGGGGGGKAAGPGGIPVSLVRSPYLSAPAAGLTRSPITRIKARVSSAQITRTTGVPAGRGSVGGAHTGSNIVMPGRFNNTSAEDVDIGPVYDSEYGRTRGGPPAGPHPPSWTGTGSALARPAARIVAAPLASPPPVPSAYVHAAAEPVTGPRRAVTSRGTGVGLGENASPVTPLLASPSYSPLSKTKRSVKLGPPLRVPVQPQFYTDEESELVRPAGMGLYGWPMAGEVLDTSLMGGALNLSYRSNSSALAAKNSNVQSVGGKPAASITYGRVARGKAQAREPAQHYFGAVAAYRQVAVEY